MNMATFENNPVIEFVAHFVPPFQGLNLFKGRDTQGVALGCHEHHKKRDFKAEFREFCQKYKVALDERYVWD